jgi:hypothetical protein
MRDAHIRGGNSVKLRALEVITLVVLGCSFASAQTFSLWTAGGSYEFCNFHVITCNSDGVVAGYDDTTTLCGFEYNAPIVGFDATVANDGEPAYGKGVVVSDAIFDASTDAYTGLQWTVFQTLTPASGTHGPDALKGSSGWMGVAGSYSGNYFGDNYGFLTAGPPEEGKVAGHGTIAGKLPEKLRK